MHIQIEIWQSKRSCRTVSRKYFTGYVESILFFTVWELLGHSLTSNCAPGEEVWPALGAKVRAIHLHNWNSPAP